MDFRASNRFYGSNFDLHFLACFLRLTPSKTIDLLAFGLFLLGTRGILDQRTTGATIGPVMVLTRNLVTGDQIDQNPTLLQ